ncbi:MAG: porin [Loktanella sp.]|nr:porin [Loktanella sp.]
MKSILLTTTALVAFAGAAVADGHTGVSFSGAAELGYNDDTTSFGEDGFYWDAELGVNMAAELDNGVAAGAAFTFAVVDGNNGNDATELEVDGDYVLSLTTEGAGLYFGDTEFAAKSLWKSAGDMEADAFSEADGETVIRGDVTVAGIKTSLSYRIADANGDLIGATTADDVDQLSIGVAGSAGMFNFTAAYQAEAETGAAGNVDFKEAETYGVSGSTSLSGATVSLGFAQTSKFGTAAEKTSIGVQVAYPFGPVTATVYYVSEDVDGAEVDDNYGLTVAYAEGPLKASLKLRNEQGRDEWNIDGSYDLGNGMTILAGMLNENEGDDNDYYVGGTYDLGGGAELLAVFAEDKDADQKDEIGAPEFMPGTTVVASFKF